MDLLKSVHEEQGMTMILVTHDMHVARAADRIITMRDGQIISDEPSHHSVESVA